MEPPLKWLPSAPLLMAPVSGASSSLFLCESGPIISQTVEPLPPITAVNPPRGGQALEQVLVQPLQQKTDGEGQDDYARRR